MAATSPKKKPVRKMKKQFEMVTFPLEGWEGDFSLPKLDLLPLGVAADLNDGNVFALIDFLEANSPESTAAVKELSGDEIGDFMDAWGAASGADLGESAA